MDKLLLVIAPKQARFTLAQFQTLVDICVGTGLVSLASVVIPPIVDRAISLMLIFGLGSTLSFWIIALWFARRIT